LRPARSCPEAGGHMRGVVEKRPKPSPGLLGALRALSSSQPPPARCCGGPSCGLLAARLPVKALSAGVSPAVPGLNRSGSGSGAADMPPARRLLPRGRWVCEGGGPEEAGPPPQASRGLSGPRLVDNPPWLGAAGSPAPAPPLWRLPPAVRGSDSSGSGSGAADASPARRILPRGRRIHEGGCREEARSLSLGP